jgi:hypothetical protein
VILAQAKRHLRIAHPSLGVIRTRCGRRSGYLWLLNGQPLVLTTFGCLEALVIIITEVTRRYAEQERKRARDRAYYHANREKRLACREAYVAANREECRGGLPKVARAQPRLLHGILPGQ